MVGRELHKEWVGRTANSAVPWYVKERLLEAADNKCQGPCHQPIGPGNSFETDHVVPLKDWLGEGHGNRESNLQILCKKICHKTKSRVEAIARANASRTRKHLWGHKKPKRIMPGSRASKWKKKLDGTVVLRD